MQQKRKKKSKILPKPRFVELSKAEIKKLQEKSLSKEERDAIYQRWQIGPYRTWQFSLERFHEVCRLAEESNSNRMYTAACNHVRKNYPEYAHMSDKEIVEQGIHGLWWSDTSHMRKGQPKGWKKNLTVDNFEDFE